jgi:hypothetical protein
MSAIGQLGANRINADTAGLTSSELDVPTAQGTTFSEVLSGIGSEYGGLSGLFNDGIPAAVNTSVAKATDSVRGPLGGLIPKRGSVVAAGPTVTPDSAKPAIVSTARSLRNTIRDKFGV